MNQFDQAANGGKSIAQARQVKSMKKLQTLKADLIQERMKEVKYKPDLSITKRFNRKISKSVVDIYRKKSIIKHQEKSDPVRQVKIKALQNEMEGCTFKPRINKSSQRLKRSLSSLYTSPKPRIKVDLQDLYYV